jgi:hypothetical protein
MKYLYIYNIDQALTFPYKFFSYTTCITECPTTTGGTLVCSDQAACDSQTTLYTTYELMDYCIPVKSSLTGSAATNFDDAM